MAAELAERRVRDVPGELAVADHAGGVQVFDDDRGVPVGEIGRDLMQQRLTDGSDAGVDLAQAACCLGPTARALPVPLFAAKDAGCCMAALGPIRPFRTPVERAHLPEDRRRLLPTMLSRRRRQGPASGSAPSTGSVSATGWTRGDSRATWTSRLLPELLPNQLTRVGSTADAPALASSATRL